MSDEEKLLESLIMYLIDDQKNILYVYMVMVLQGSQLLLKNSN